MLKEQGLIKKIQFLFTIAFQKKFRKYSNILLLKWKNWSQIQKEQVQALTGQIHVLLRSVDFLDEIRIAKKLVKLADI